MGISGGDRRSDQYSDNRRDFIIMEQTVDEDPIQSFRGLHLFYNYSEIGFEYFIAFD